LADKKVQPVMIRPSQRGTRKPLPCGRSWPPEATRGERNERDAGVRDRSELRRAATGALSTSRPTRRRTRVPREHDSIRDDCPVRASCVFELVARSWLAGGPLPLRLLELHALGPAGPRRALRRYGPSPPRISEEEGPDLGTGARRGLGVLRANSLSARSHAAMADESPCHLGGYDDERELVETAGVDGRRARGRRAARGKP